MGNSVFPWQIDDWRRLRQLAARLPHALLFHGAEGIGKTCFAEAFAQALLCQAPDAEGHACGTCASCGWFAQGNHPDYRCVRPEALEAADDDEAADEDGKKGAKSKTPSKDIRIDQIRALADFMNISTHRRGVRVVLLYPAEALNAPAANALLKTLEEPPPDTVFLLVTHNPDRLLPTILSRCRKFALALPAPDAALAWLRQQGVAAADAEMWLAEQGGAPLAARALAEGGEREAMEEFLRQLAQPGVDGALKAAEKLQKVPLPEQVAWLQRWLYDLFALKLAGRVRYYPRYRKELAALAGRAEAGALAQAIKSAGERAAVAAHPLSPRLFIEDMLIEYSTIFSDSRA
ncbi:MAG: DNA polymerase III subunit delta' [Burkholderiaceae bacterium]